MSLQNFCAFPFILVCVVALHVNALARADGVYIPQRAFPVLPTIPRQQAVIIHRNGTETLIVESAFQSQSPDVAWILPLPTEPSKLQLAESGAVASTAFGLTPEIRHDLHDLTTIPFITSLAILPFATVIIFTRDRARRASSVRSIIAVELILLFFSAIMLPSLGSAGTPAVNTAQGISILSAQRLGDADFKVLKAATPEALDQWLAAEALHPLDPTAKAIIAGYIAHQWCFVIGHLQSTPGTLAVPRPLMATFPASQPIFPMKSTALANTTTHVELCVISDQQAAADKFHCILADRFTYHPAEAYMTIYLKEADYYASPDNKVAVGHPDVISLMWNNCVVTKLAADLTPSDMHDDIAISLSPLVPHRDIFYTSLARRQIAFALFASEIAAFLIAAAILLRGRRTPSPAATRFLKISLALTCIAPVIVWIALPTTAVQIEDRSLRFMKYEQPRRLFDAANELASKGIIHPGMNPAEMAALPNLLANEVSHSSLPITNPFTGQPLRQESSPGNFALRTIKGKLYFCTYNSAGIESRAMILPKK